MILQSWGVASMGKLNVGEDLALIGAWFTVMADFMAAIGATIIVEPETETTNPTPENGIQQQLADMQTQMRRQKKQFQKQQIQFQLWQMQLELKELEQQTKGKRG